MDVISRPDKAPNLNMCNEDFFEVWQSGLLQVSLLILSRILCGIQRVHLHRHQQVFGERPLAVDPLLL